MLKKLLNCLAVATTIAVSCAPDVVAAEMGYAAQTSNERGIKITVTPQAIQNAWDFEVTLESHTQALSDDMTKSAVVIADGKQYLPLVWEGAPPGGHHRKGLLRFKRIVPQPQLIELQIRLTGDTSPRSFKWFLK
jgi:hypothetical protein